MTSSSPPIRLLRREKRRLSPREKEIFKKEYEKKIEEICKEKGRELRNKIDLAIYSAKNHMAISNMCIDPFLPYKDKDYIFVRTDPLYVQNIKNFDVMLFSYDTNTCILIECKPDLTTLISKKLIAFQKASIFTLKNSSFQDPISGEETRVQEYLSHFVKSPIREFEFVLATPIASEKDVTEVAKKLKLNFSLWGTVSLGSEMRIKYVPIRGDSSEDFYGHADRNLKKYLNSLSQSPIPYNDVLAFSIGMNKYFKIFQIMNSLIGKKEYEFNFNSWYQLFDTELKEYTDHEKKVIFKEFIDLGLSVSLIRELSENGSNIFAKDFSVVTRHRRGGSKFDEEIKNKIIRSELNAHIREIKPDIEYDVLKKVIGEQRGQKLLRDFCR